MSESEDNFQEAKTAWSAIYKRELSDEEVREINYNLYEFFCVLKRWDEEVKKRDEQSPAGNN